ncbi:MAG: basic amino acid ABC transporter substrate-binding protein [Lentisphaeria bacterium]
MKNLFLSIALTLTLFVFAGCSKKADNLKVLKIGTEATFAPFEFEENGEYVGYDMDLIRAIAKQMGVKIDITNMGFDGLIPALNAGNIDVAIAGMTITEDRKKHVTFSLPYYQSGLKVTVRKDETQIKGIEDLVGKNIGVQIGTTGAIMAGKVKDAKVKNFNANTDAVLELKNGGIDAIIQDLPVMSYFLKSGGGDAYAKLVGKTLSAEEYGIVTKKDNTKLAKEISAALTALKANGKYKEIYEKWFGSNVD